MNARPKVASNRAASRWYDVWLRVFLIGAIGSLAVVALGPLEQITVIGAATLVCSLLGAVTCAVGLSLYDPRRWRELRSHVTRVGDALNDARAIVGEPYQMARARVEPRDTP